MNLIPSLIEKGQHKPNEINLHAVLSLRQYYIDEIAVVPTININSYYIGQV